MKDSPELRLDAALRRELKQAAKARVLPRLPLCAAAILAYVLPALLISFITAVPLDASPARMLAMSAATYACVIVLLGPVMLGMQYFFVETARGRAAGINAVFAPLGELREALRGIRMMLCLLLRTLLLGLVPTALYVALTAGALLYLDANSVTDPETISGVVAALVFVYIVLLLPIAGRCASYVLGYGLLHDDPNCGVWRATREGSRLLRGNRRGMLSFVLSFAPWYLAAFLTCGVTAIFGSLYLLTALHLLGDRLRTPSEPPAAS